MLNDISVLKSNTTIYGKELTLHPISEEDLEYIRIWRNKDNIRLSFINNSIITKESQKNWYDLYRKKENDIMFIIVHNASHKKIGAVALYDINFEDKTAEFGRLMIGDDSFRGHNYGLESTKLVIDFAITNLKLKEVILYVFKDNTPAIKIYSKAGFFCISSCEDEYKLLKMSYTSPS